MYLIPQTHPRNWWIIQLLDSLDLGREMPEAQIKDIDKDWYEAHSSLPVNKGMREVGPLNWIPIALLFDQYREAAFSAILEGVDTHDADRKCCHSSLLRIEQATERKIHQPDTQQFVERHNI
jgi:hypothetical protein